MYDLDTVLKTLRRMKSALDEKGLSPYLMCQPIGWRCPEVENHPHGYLALPDCPLGKKTISHGSKLLCLTIPES